MVENGASNPVRYRLTLYISGGGPDSRRAIENAQAICGTYLRGMAELEVIDVLEHPEAAERDKILATPTLLRRFPLPARKIIGDLSDLERALGALEVYAHFAAPDGDPSGPPER